MKYKISVIIPTFNSEEFLLETINSIKNQSLGFENIEVIIVDDGSTDNTKNILNNLSKQYDNIKPFFLEENTGTASEPRNVGIRNSTADYVMFIDSDDEYYPTMCEIMYKTITFYDADIASCRYNWDTKTSSKAPYSFLDNFNPLRFKKFKGKFFEEERIIYLDSIDEFPDIMTMGHPTMLWNKIIKKSVILDNNIVMPKGDLYEDVYLPAKVYLIAKGIVILNEFWGYSYQIRNEEDNKSLTHVYSISLLSKQLRGFLACKDFLKKENGKYRILESELLIDLTKIFMYSDITKDEKNEFLEIVKPFYKEYKFTTRVHTARLPLNIIINIFIKLFSFNNKIGIITSEIFAKIKRN
ncbi:MAG: glycosyltransferase family 2 protein [archaeon]|nr:glycosyltransferase family 2 protein [archaeon]